MSLALSSGTGKAKTTKAQKRAAAEALVAAAAKSNSMFAQEDSDSSHSADEGIQQQYQNGGEEEEGGEEMVLEEEGQAPKRRRSSRHALWSLVTPTEDGRRTICGFCHQMLALKMGYKIERLRQHFGFNSQYVKVRPGGCVASPFEMNGVYGTGISLLNTAQYQPVSALDIAHALVPSSLPAPLDGSVGQSYASISNATLHKRFSEFSSEFASYKEDMDNTIQQLIQRQSELEAQVLALQQAATAATTSSKRK